ncbi:MAG: isoprenylcysteine carboxylmethyltransferase family protein [Gemmatimonadaceae bacterium]
MSDRPLPFVSPYAFVFWIVYVWAFWPEWKILIKARNGAKTPDSKDGGSIGVIMGLTWIALFIAFPASFVPALSFPGRARLPLFIAGLLMIVLGSLLRRYCWRTLGEYFTGDVQARADQPVIMSGPYKLIRHPSYTAGIMMFIGIGLALGGWLGLVLITVAIISAYCYRVAVEERALLATIGEPYRTFMSTRKRFIPYIV